MTKEKYKILVDSCISKKRDNGDEFYCLKNDLDEDVKNLILEVMRRLDQYDFDLQYTMLNDALNELSEVEFEDLKGYEVSESESEYASIYTYTRLQYLNNHNEPEIYDTLKEYDCDIQTACAIWYDNQVKDLLTALVEEILKDSEEEKCGHLVTKAIYENKKLKGYECKSCEEVLPINPQYQKNKKEVEL